VSIHGSHFAEGASTEALMILQAFDVTARRVVERRLQHPACHDSLTDLANRGRRVDEGIETRAKLDRLAERGCGDVQGFRLSRPLAVEPVGAMLPGAR
jgi:predicted signal transduction protein with EAL and GGDEF domain